MASLYLHIPFCRKKCSYCDFFSVPASADQLELWPRLLQIDLQQFARQQAPSLETIFFGGGTPSLLSAVQIKDILDCCRSLFPCSPQLEISIEANPATVTDESLAGYLDAGINRLSLGIQSFDDSMLQLLGRGHTAADAVLAFETARRIGFTNISVDLIFALPGQNIKSLEQEIDQLLALAPDHIGIYGLSIESGTPLEQLIATGQLLEADEEVYVESYRLLNRQLVAAGFEHYEISNFARPGFRCQHNQAYWQRRSCLAVGAGAHGFTAEGYGQRYVIPADLARYRQQLEAGLDPSEFLERFSPLQAMAETLYLALRTSDGIDCADFERRFGQRPEQAYPAAFKRISPYLQRHNNQLSFNLEGWLLYDHLISHFL